MFGAMQHRLTMWSVILTCLLLSTPSQSRSLRASHRESELVPLAFNETPEEINEKWDNMDDFLGIMFQLACKWKHGKDVNGAAAEKLANGELHHTEVEGYKKELQAANLQGVIQACGKLTATGKARCRMSCADRWGQAMQDRSDCDEKCVSVYDRFGSDCKAKADNLEKVYEMKLRSASGRKTCHEGHCPNIPTVWMKLPADMQLERDTQCASQCTAEMITLKCQRQWALQVDFVMANITSQCFQEGQMKQCFDTAKDTASTAQDTCSSGGKSDCSTQYDTCVADGQTDSTFKEAEEFCEQRKKMCEEQVVDKCLKEFQAALDEAQKTCEEGDSTALEQCKTDRLATAESNALSACEAEDGPTCVSKCEESCDVTALATCLDNLKSDHDPAEDFCEDFWRLLHESSEVDPVTGDPIVLLAK